MLTTLGSSTLLADKFGQAAPQVCALHGWGRTGADFQRILAPHSGVAVHLPGFGPAPPPPRAWSSADYANEIAAALETLSPMVLVGHSFGGRIALRLAASFPHLVKHLVLTGVPLTRVTPAHRPALGFRVVKSLSKAGLVSDALLERARNKYGSADYRAASGVMRDILVHVVREDYLEDAARVACPVTLVWGELDRPAPRAAAEKALPFFPQATLRVVAGAGHLLEGTLEQEVATAVTDALRT